LACGTVAVHEVLVGRAHGVGGSDVDMHVLAVRVCPGWYGKGLNGKCKELGFDLSNTGGIRFDCCPGFWCKKMGTAGRVGPLRRRWLCRPGTGQNRLEVEIAHERGELPAPALAPTPAKSSAQP
jgi:hypothetical protein